MCKLLINKGIDQNIRDKYGFTPSYWAKQSGHKDILLMMEPPLKISKEEYHEHMRSYWGAHNIKIGGGKKKKKKGKKKK